jgi:DNA polymerase III epsilon subunit-like protein
MSDTARSVTGDYVEPEGGIQMPAKELSLPLRSTDRPNNTRQICIHFRIRPDKCKYGDKCNFSHDLSTALPTTGFHANNDGVNSTVRNTGGGRGFAGGRGGRGGRYYNAPSNNMPQNGYGGHNVQYMPPSNVFYNQQGMSMMSQGALPPSTGGVPSQLYTGGTPTAYGTHRGDVTRTPPAPVYITTPPGIPIFCIDVECVATTVEHTGRSVAQVSLVNEWGQPVLNVYVKQEQPVASYITELTGLTKEIMDENGVPMSEALESLRSKLPSNAILVGQNILKDVQWLNLVEGKDFGTMLDLSGIFRVWNTQRNEYTAFGQDHCARVWLGIADRTSHDAVADAQISMALFNAYRNIQQDPMHLSAMQYNTLMAPRIPSFSANNPVIDGCCMGNRKKCTCGAPWL